MKKLLTLLLALVAVISVIGAGCQLAGSSGTTVTAEEAQKAKTYIETKYRGESEITASDYKLDAQVGIDGTIVKVEWSADTDKVSIGTEMDDYGQITVKVTKTDVEVPYVLTAKIYDSDRNCLETTFNRKIPAYVLYNWEQYLAAEDGAVFSIEGIVTSIWGKSLGNTYNGMYVQDLENKGGYYIYGLASDASADGVKAGMKVSVTGTYVKKYVELKDATCTVLDTNITTVEPTDYTEIYKNATSLKDTALLEKQTLLVTLKGVELQPQTEEDISKGYYRFKLGNLTSYVRISSSVCPMTAEEQAQFKADFAANVGNKADIVGIASAYNGAFYIVPAAAGAYSNYQVVTKTDEEKANIELEGAILSKTTFTETETITLPTVKTYTDAVTFEWASDSANAVVENGELKITIPESTTTAKLTLTVKCGEVTKTKEFTLTLQNATLNHAGTAADPFDCADTLAILNSLATGKTYSDADGNPIMVYIKGYVVVEGIAGNYQSKFYIADAVDAESKVYVFSANYTTEVSGISLGDLVVVKGFLVDYNGTKEVAQATVDGTKTYPTIVSKTEATEEDVATLVLAGLTVKATLDADYTLPTSTHATIVWSVKEESTALTIVDGVAKVTRGTEDATVVLVATIGAQKKEFTVTVVKADEGGETEETKITFNLGEDGTSSNLGGDSVGTTYTEASAEDPNIKLTLKDCSNVYTGTVAGNGDGALRMGASSKGGKFTIVVPEGVKKVVIYFSYYDASASVLINGEDSGTFSSKWESADCTPDAKEVIISDTTKEITVATRVASKCRVVIHKIEFIY